MRTALSIMVLVLLSGCYCPPEKGDKTDSNYFHNCWDHVAHHDK